MAEPKFVIDGRDYPIPGMEEFTIGESLTLHEYTGLSIDEVDDDTPRMPLVAAFMHIAYVRGNPGVNEAKVKKIIRSANIADALEHMAEAEVEAEDPTKASAQLTEPSSSEKMNSEAEPSGKSSTELSAQQENGRSLTGVPDSPSSVISDREISAA